MLVIKISGAGILVNDVGSKRIVLMERRWFEAGKQDNTLSFTGNYRKFMNIIEREKSQSMFAEMEQVLIRKGINR